MKWRKVECIPVKGRPRHNSRGVTYTDAKTREQLKAVADSWDGEFYESESLVLIVEVYKELPKTTAKYIESIEYTSRPDVDNIAKAVMDGLNGVAFHDDSQITTIITAKKPRTRQIQGQYIEYLLAPSSEVKIWVQTL